MAAAVPGLRLYQAMAAAVRWLRLCDRDGCWCAMTAGDGCCWARRSLWQCPAMAAAVSGVGCWLLTVSCRLLAVGCWLVLCQAMAAAVPGGGCGSARWWLRLCQFISSWLSAVGCRPLAVGCWLSVIGWCCARRWVAAVPGGGCWLSAADVNTASRDNPSARAPPTLAGNASACAGTRGLSAP